MSDPRARQWALADQVLCIGQGPVILDPGLSICTHTHMYMYIHTCACTHVHTHMFCRFVGFLLFGRLVLPTCWGFWDSDWEVSLQDVHHLVTRPRFPQKPHFGVTASLIHSVLPPVRWLFDLYCACDCDCDCEGREDPGNQPNPSESTPLEMG